MSDELLTVGVGAGSAVGGSLVTWLVQQWIGRTFRKEDKAETDRDHKLDQVLDAVQGLELELRTVTEKLSGHDKSVDALRERLDGFSADHSKRLKALEEGHVEVRTLVEQYLVPKRRRAGR